MSPADAAQELIRRRAHNPPSTDGALEAILASSAYAVLFRPVASPNIELARFVSLASGCGLTPLVLEFHRDKFVTRNPGKYALARMSFLDGTGRNGGSRIKHLSVIDLPKADGRRFSEVTTVWGDPFISFHHELLSRFPPDIPVTCFDGSDWFNSHGSTACNYYVDFISLFIRHAVLFEDFLLAPREEAAFTVEVVAPAFAEVTARHSIQPLICRLDPPEQEGCTSLYSYHIDMHNYVSTRIVQRT